MFPFTFSTQPFFELKISELPNSVVCLALQTLPKLFLFSIQKTSVKALIFFWCVLLPFSLKCQHGVLSFICPERWDKKHFQKNFFHGYFYYYFPKSFWMSNLNNFHENLWLSKRKRFTKAQIFSITLLIMGKLSRNRATFKRMNRIYGMYF